MMSARCCSAPSLHLHSEASQPREWCYPEWAGLPISIHAIMTTSHRHAHRSVFQVILDSVKLTINSVTTGSLVTPTLLCLHTSTNLETT